MTGSGLAATALVIVQWFIAGASAITMLRIILGPRAADRLAALNVLSGLALAFLVVRGLAENRALYFDVALVYDIFGFLGFLAVARFLRDRMSNSESGR